MGFEDGARRNFKHDVSLALTVVRVEDVCGEAAFIASRWVLMSSRSRRTAQEGDGRSFYSTPFCEDCVG
jgi:hypothetical protein